MSGYYGDGDDLSGVIAGHKSHQQCRIQSINVLDPTDPQT